MSQDAEKYERLVTLAGWFWMRIRDGKPHFRRSELSEVEGLDHLGGSGAASRKAFERATDDLETFGVEIEWDGTFVNDADPDASGAYRITGLKLTPAQQQALMGLAFTIAYRDLATDAALRIPGSFLEGAGDTLLLDANRFVAPVAEAIDEQTCISFIYNDEGEARQVQPIRLGFERGTWYVSAYEFSSDMTKVFRLDKIGSVEQSENVWSEAHDTEDAREMVSRARDRFRWGSEEIEEVILAIDPDAVLSAMRLIPLLEEIGEEPDGRLVMTREYSNTENMLDVVLTLGRRAEILGPPHLRQAMVDHLSAMTARVE